MNKEPIGTWPAYVHAKDPLTKQVTVKGPGLKVMVEGDHDIANLAVQGRVTVSLRKPQEERDAGTVASVSAVPWSVDSAGALLAGDGVQAFVATEDGKVEDAMLDALLTSSPLRLDVSLGAS